MNFFDGAIYNLLERVFYFLLVLGSLVFIHELGHFLAAKLFRIRVETFSLGFGPRLAGFRRGDTDYRLAAIPLGGYVKMAGEYDIEEVDQHEPPDPSLLTSKPRWQRFIVSAAGPVMNVLVAICIWWGLFMHGMWISNTPDASPVVHSVEAGSPAESAGLLPGDRILSLDGKALDSIQTYYEERVFRPEQSVVYVIDRQGERLDLELRLGKHEIHGYGTDGVLVDVQVYFGDVVADSPAERGGLKPGDRLLSVDGRVPSGITEFVEIIEAHPEQPLDFVVERGGEELALVLTPEAVEEGKGRIGVHFATEFVSYDLIPALGMALGEAWDKCALLFRTLSELVQLNVGMEVVSGPLEIARISQDQAQYGWLPLLHLVAFISLNLGIFNLLPIPVLDGGAILVLLIESTIRRDISLAIKERIFQVGFVVLIVFAAAVITLDVRKAFIASGSEKEAAATSGAADEPAENPAGDAAPEDPLPAGE